MQPSKIYEARGLRVKIQFPFHRGQTFARKMYENNRALYNYWNIYERGEVYEEQSRYTVSNTEPSTVHGLNGSRVIQGNSYHG